MGLLSFLTNNAPGINALAGGLNVLDGLTGYSQNRALKKQFEYNSKLMDKQQEYSRENATTAYNRQIELTQMNPLLQTVGTRQAGHNVAMGGQGSSAIASVDSAASPSNPSVSAPDYQQSSQQFMQGINQLLNSSFDFENKKNESRAIKAQADKAESDAKISASDAEVHQFKNDLTLHSMETSNALYDLTLSNEKEFGRKSRLEEYKKLKSEALSSAHRADMDGTDADFYFLEKMRDLQIKYQTYLNFLENRELTKAQRAEIYKRMELLGVQIKTEQEKFRIAREEADYNEETHDLRVTHSNVENYPFTFKDNYINQELFVKGYSDVLPKNMSSGDINSLYDFYIYYRKLGLTDTEIRELFNIGESSPQKMISYLQSLRKIFTKKP